MSVELRKVFEQEKSVFVGFVTAGYPSPSLTVDILLAMQQGGVDVIELGIPSSDPVADGEAISSASQVALTHGVDLSQCILFVEQARAKGLVVPVVFMGYCNPFFMYGQKKLFSESKRVGVNGFIIVDLPPEEAVLFMKECHEFGLSYIPLISPVTTQKRIKQLVKCADSFIYIVSALGVTGQRTSMNTDLPVILERVQQESPLPLAVGFGVSTKEHFEQVAKLAEGVVMGSKFIAVLRDAEEKGLNCALAVKNLAETVASRSTRCNRVKRNILSTPNSVNDPLVHLLPDRFGTFGGQYAPETLILALEELEKVFNTVKNDPTFWTEFYSYYDYIGRPSRLQFAQNLTSESRARAQKSGMAGNGANIWLKREDLNHTGSHKINNALGQILLAKRIGKKRIIAETGAGQHGVATATMCAHFNLPCTIYMGEVDTERQQLNVFRMQLLGATVIPVKSGTRTLKDAVNEAMRDWVTNVNDTHYIIGSAIGPHPFPTIVREFQSVIGKETKQQFNSLHSGRNPDVLVACVGGGSNAIGLFSPFINETVSFNSDQKVRLVGVEAGGEGISTGHHSATLSAGKPGVLHGCRTYLLQDANGQTIETHSISAGLDYPGVGPEHSMLKDDKRAEYVAVTDKEALIGFKEMSRLEGIIPALETSHAVYHVLELASTLSNDQHIVLCVSGRGDKDVSQVKDLLPKYEIKL